MSNDTFRRLAARASDVLGSSTAFIAAVALVVGWAAAGPLFRYSDSWELFINTATTIVTFLMVFLIQNTQNRDVKALHLKLDELIRAVGGARNQLMRLESMTDEELAALQDEFESLRSRSERARMLREERAKARAAREADAGEQPRDPLTAGR